MYRVLASVIQGQHIHFPGNRTKVYIFHNKLCIPAFLSFSNIRQMYLSAWHVVYEGAVVKLKVEVVMVHVAFLPPIKPLCCCFQARLCFICTLLLETFD